MRFSARFLFLAAALFLLAGLGSMALRTWRGARAVDSAVEHAALVARETKAQVAEVVARKPELLVELERLQQADQDEQVLALASRYRLADDPDIRRFHARSAQKLSLRQTLERMVALTAEHCQEPQARALLAARFEQAAPWLSAVNPADWVWQRAATAEFVSAIEQRVRSWASLPPPHEQAGEGTAAEAPPTSALEALRGDHIPRISPAVAFALMQGLPVERLLCVWRVGGKIAQSRTPSAAEAPRSFALTLWMAPAATERGMELDVLDLDAP